MGVSIRGAEAREDTRAVEAREDTRGVTVLLGVFRARRAPFFFFLPSSITVFDEEYELTTRRFIL